jgi:hypothetical protein
MFLSPGSILKSPGNLKKRDRCPGPVPYVRKSTGSTGKIPCDLMASQLGILTSHRLNFSEARESVLQRSATVVLLLSIDFEWQDAIIHTVIFDELAFEATS